MSLLKDQDIAAGVQVGCEACGIACTVANANGSMESMLSYVEDINSDSIETPVSVLTEPLGPLI